MKRLVLLCSVLITLSVKSTAQNDDTFTVLADSTYSVATKAMADSAYTSGDYTTAIALYEQILQTGESSVLYYNLGNAYFKTDDMARAILNYERALLLNPSDKDIHFNLDLARSKTVDRVTGNTELFFVRWFRSFAGMLSLDAWAYTAVALFILAICSILAFIFCKKGKIKKIFFIFAAILLILTFGTNMIGHSQKKRLTVHNCAIVMSPSVVVRSTPSVTGTDLFVLHEGRKVTITDDSMAAWKEIELEDGNVGWIEAESLERI